MGHSGSPSRTFLPFTTMCAIYALFIFCMYIVYIKREREIGSGSTLPRRVHNTLMCTRPFSTLACTQLTRSLPLICAHLQGPRGHGQWHEPYWQVPQSRWRHGRCGVANLQLRHLALCTHPLSPWVFKVEASSFWMRMSPGMDGAQVYAPSATLLLTQT
jgi:hypothetical protein